MSIWLLFIRDPKGSYDRWLRSFFTQRSFEGHYRKCSDFHGGRWKGVETRTDRAILWSNIGIDWAIEPQSAAMNILRLAPILSDENRCRSFCEERRLISFKCYCSDPEKWMERRSGSKTSHFGIFRCRGPKHDYFVSVSTDTWFEQSRVTPPVTLLITYCFARGLDLRR